jgi:hypothetical protein
MGSHLAPWLASFVPTTLRTKATQELPLPFFYRLIPITAPSGPFHLQPQPFGKVFQRLAHDPGFVVPATGPAKVVLNLLKQAIGSYFY